MDFMILIYIDYHLFGLFCVIISIIMYILCVVYYVFA